MAEHISEQAGREEGVHQCGVMQGRGSCCANSLFEDVATKPGTAVVLFLNRKYRQPQKKSDWLEPVVEI